MKDLLTGLVLAALMVVLLVSAQQLPPSRYEPLGAAFLAKAVPVATLLLSLYLIVRGAIVMRRVPWAMAVSPAGRVTTLRIAAMLVLMAAWVALMQGSATFRWSTLLFLLTSALVLGVPRRVPSLFLLLAVALVVAFGMDFVFRSYLDVILP